MATDLDGQDAGRTGARSKLRPWWPILVGLLVAALAVAVFLRQSSQDREMNSQANAITKLYGGKQTQDAQIQGLAGAVNSARAQIQSLGATPVVPAATQILKTVAVPGPAGSPGPAGVGATGPAGPGPSDAQVEGAVSAYLAAHPVPGVSSQQVASAVDAYFVASPPPSGPAGPGPSQQEIADAVASYMAANPAPSGAAGSPGSAGSAGPSGPVGPQGPQGNPGQNGADGSPPAGWSWTDPSGNTYTCAQTGATPSPNYTCTLESSPSASTSASASTSSSASPGAQASTAPPSAAPSTTPPTTAAATPAATVSTPSTPSPSTSTAAAPATPTGSPTTRGLLLLALPLLRRDDLYVLGDA